MTGISVNIQQKIYLWNRIYIYIIQCIILSIKIPQKGREKNFNVFQELQKDESFRTLSTTIHLEGWARHFEHEYIIKASKNLIES